MSELNITERAIKEVKRVMEEQNYSVEEWLLEAGISAGGCSGYSYKLGFKKRADVDSNKESILNFDGMDIAVNQKSLLFMEGTTIDFHEGLDARGFLFENPHATRTCGCGKSFSA
jgi:iron-sulfur cluster assembly protein